MKLGSLFDGIGGFPLVGSWLGFEPVWASEIEEKPISITKRHFPNMKHLGDITKINGAEIEPVDLITFGSPCQDLSVAGKRAGLEGSRSSLFLDAVRIIYEMRKKTNGEYPKFAVWENVPGAFSSNKGLDFRAVLEEIGQAEIPMPEHLGKWATAGMVRTESCGIAWRTLDAQYWGVPQRRKRIFLIADFRDEPKPEILFEPEGVSRYFTQSKDTRERIAGNIESCFGEAICVDGYNSSVDDVASTLGVNCGMSTGRNGVPALNSVASTLRAGAGASKHGSDYKGRLVLSIESPNRSFGVCTKGNGDCFLSPEKHTSLSQGGGQAGQGYPCVLSLENHGKDGRYKIIENEKVQTLSAAMGMGGGNVPLCMQKCYGICSQSSNSMKSDNPHSGIYEAEVAKTLDVNAGNPSCNQGGNCVVFACNQRDEVRDLHGVVGALQAQPGMKQQTFCIQGNCIDRADTAGCNGKGWNDEGVSYTLNTVDRPAVVYALDRETFNCGQKYARKMGITEDGINSTLNAQGPSAGAVFREKTDALCASYGTKWNGNASAENGSLFAVTDYTVRRLTPLECERLQGFPDYWTLYGADGEEISDTQRYKALGNSVALPCVEFVLTQIFIELLLY